MMGDGMMNGGGLWPFMFGWMTLGWALVVAVLIAVVISILWVMRRASVTSPRVDSPLEILKRRYAQGELSSEQFETMKRQLSGD